MHLVGPKITKKTTNMRKPVPPEAKLAITLRFLTAGETFESLQLHYRIHATTIAQFIPNKYYDTLAIILFLIVLVQQMVNKFPYVKPTGSGSQYYNYRIIPISNPR